MDSEIQRHDKEVKEVKNRQAIDRGTWTAMPTKVASRYNGAKRKADGNPRGEDRAKADTADLTEQEILKLHRSAQTLKRPQLLITKQPDPSIFYKNVRKTGSKTTEDQDLKTPGVFSVEAMLIGVPEDRDFCQQPTATLRILPEAEAQVLRFGYADRLTICRCSKHGMGFINDIKRKKKICDGRCKSRQVDVGLATIKERLDFVDECVYPLKIKTASNWTIGEAKKSSQMQPCGHGIYIVSFKVEITGRQDEANGVSLKQYYGVVSMDNEHVFSLQFVFGTHETDLAKDGAEDTLAQYILWFQSDLPPRPIRLRRQGKTVKEAEVEMKELTLQELLTRRQEANKNLMCPVDLIVKFNAARMKKYAQIQTEFDKRCQDQWAKELTNFGSVHGGISIPGFCSWGAYVQSSWGSFFAQLVEEVRKNRSIRELLEESWMFLVMDWSELESIMKTFVMSNPTYRGKNLIALKISNDPTSLQATLGFYNSAKNKRVRLFCCLLSHLKDIGKILNELRRSLNERDNFQIDYFLHPAEDGSVVVSPCEKFPNFKMEEVTSGRHEPKAPYYGECQMTIPLFDRDEEKMTEAENLLQGRLAASAGDVDWVQVNRNRRNVFHALVESLEKLLNELPKKIRRSASHQPVLEEQELEGTDTNEQLHYQMSIPFSQVDDEMMVEAQNLLMGELATAARKKDWTKTAMDRRPLLRLLVQSLGEELACLPDKTDLPEWGHQVIAMGMTQTSPFNNRLQHHSPMVSDQEYPLGPQMSPVQQSFQATSWQHLSPVEELAASPEAGSNSALPSIQLHDRPCSSGVQTSLLVGNLSGTHPHQLPESSLTVLDEREVEHYNQLGIQSSQHQGCFFRKLQQSFFRMKRF